MKILIVSDSHGDVSALKAMVEREAPDRVFHLGDVLRDARRLSAAFPETPLDAVAGNCDGWDGGGGEAEELLVEAGGARFFLTHGHRYHVKLGLGLVVREAQEKGADVVCFGHTHKALCRLWTGGTWVVNPGSAGGVHAPATYAVAEVENGEITVQIREL